MGRQASRRPEPLQRQAHPADRARPAPAAARQLPRVRARLLDAHPARLGHLHARTRGQPLHPRRERGELPLARRGLRRPDPPARRRDAHDRRRLPPACPADHAARLPPRPPRGHDRDDGARDRARARRLVAGERGRRLPLDARAGPADRHARPVRLRPRARQPRLRHRRGVRAGALVLRARLLPAEPARAGDAVEAHAPRAGAARPGDLRRDRPAARRGRLRRGHPLAPHAGGRRGRRAPTATASCATSS